MKTVDLFEEFSSVKNLKQAYIYLQQEIQKSSLPIDPIWNTSFSAIKNLGDEFFKSLSKYLKSELYHPDKADFIHADKDNSGVRPISVLTSIDRILYQALLNPKVLGNKVDKKLHTFVFGNRVDGDEVFLSKYQNKWQRFCNSQIEAFDKGYIWRVECDIKVFFEDILVAKLIKNLTDTFQIKNEKILKILEKQLLKWAEIDGKPAGIPQGPAASHILANAYLHPLDTFMNDLIGSEIKFFRYADDMVIMGKDVERINEVTRKIGMFLRGFNMTFNEKTKVEKLENTKLIEEKKFYNEYGERNAPAKEKIEKISKNLPTIFTKIKDGADVPRIELGELKYFLKAEAGNRDKTIIANLIEIIRHKPSFIQFICRYLGVFFSTSDPIFYLENREFINSKYKEILGILKAKRYSEWTEFWLFKTLSVSHLSQDCPEFTEEVERLLKDSKTPFLVNLVGLFFVTFKDFEIDKVGFNLDDLKRFINRSKSQLEKASYYFFLIYLKGKEENDSVLEMIVEALCSKSPEIQLIGIFLAKQFKMKAAQENFGDLAKIYFKLPLTQAVITKQPKEYIQNGYIPFEGKISVDQLGPFFGFSRTQKDIRKNVKKGEAIKKPFIKRNPTGNDKEFGNGYFITVQGHIYEKSTGKKIANAQGAGYYLLIRLLSSNGGKGLGRKDFKPTNETSKFTWKTIKKARGIIIKACGDVIDTNTSDEYFYCYQPNKVTASVTR